MRYRIIADSSCDLPSDFLEKDDIDFSIVPLTITVDGKDYSPQRISNAYITWREEVYADADISLQAKINRTCVLVLMAILKDELP